MGESLPEDGFLRLTHVANEGGVFGLPVNPWLSLFLASLVIIIALFIYLQYNLVRSRLMKTAFALVIGGSIGNLIDRIRLGHVTDFIDINLWGDFHWPVFNPADISIVTGVILTILFLLQWAKEPGRV